uniref:PDSW n=1 Tax=Polytomella sp. Pringsheim 198.80 TaxID=37502 RepID=UPI00172ABEE2|nr:Chain p, PDSW [Polytomella sp. Pringsheim 198.80]7ARD_p Chain p, PDSW [Polytomella sp. Pringsheim 198.80]|mmetsp:Transcript_29295/g.53774  ORF Transcript_29295/g.53774 Transcript_29295/m.53774 type:complete len:157 (-) Transcript_29295:626-1096(-)|eukprot:CAMPEP_0175059352 /NCGR_PEP_ID=MMETSP0052_2-20121109/12386_1 /TAXON_ID=51329 ORGANISM="Polytomella parva, Strain SAG 63-3" /NCGR_SAMPLE_ID=MMETSP0052_2 /ASSEMBLY_ACC=CAM_ASM_000194 /LENGTH=156 /DNA_ID=CAMNT_0016324895 /DNA_START=19 /DNA_END=489 /DNA_ORIENTATION=+
MTTATIEERRAFHKEVLDIVQSKLANKNSEWARPEEPILHNLKSEKEEPHVYYHNNNFRVTRQLIHFEKTKIFEDELDKCMRTHGEAKYRKCQEIAKRFQASCRVASNLERGPNARKRDVGFIYQNNKLRELEKDAKELGLNNPFPPSSPRTTIGY